MLGGFYIAENDCNVNFKILNKFYCHYIYLLENLEHCKQGEKAFGKEDY